MERATAKANWRAVGKGQSMRACTPPSVPFTPYSCFHSPPHLVFTTTHTLKTNNFVLVFRAMTFKKDPRGKFGRVGEKQIKMVKLCCVVSCVVLFSYFDLAFCVWLCFWQVVLWEQRDNGYRFPFFSSNIHINTHAQTTQQLLFLRENKTVPTFHPTFYSTCWMVAYEMFYYSVSFLCFRSVQRFI